MRFIAHGFSINSGTEVHTVVDAADRQEAIVHLSRRQIAWDQLVEESHPPADRNAVLAYEGRAATRSVFPVALPVDSEKKELAHDVSFPLTVFVIVFICIAAFAILVVDLRYDVAKAPAVQTSTGSTWTVPTTDDIVLAYERESLSVRTATYPGEATLLIVVTNKSSQTPLHILEVRCNGKSLHRVTFQFGPPTLFDHEGLATLAMGENANYLLRSARSPGLGVAGSIDEVEVKTDGGWTSYSVNAGSR